MLSGIIRFRKVEDVTTAKDEPAPIYLLDEVVKAAQASPEDAQHIVEHLMRKLDSKNPVVKAKSLRACKYLVLHGAVDARRILQRTSGPIRNLQTYRGSPDALKGDALNERVRVSAKEAIDAIYSTETVTQPVSKMTSNNTSSRIQGFGNQGFGNQFNSAGVSSFRSDQSYPYQSPESTIAQTQSSNSFLKEVPSVELDRGVQLQSSAKTINVLGDEEEVVNSVCQPSGVRLAPAKEDIKRFIDTVGTLDGPKVALHLQRKVEGNSWQQCYRALCLIEAIILQGSSLSCGEIGVHFQGDLNIIRKCAENTVQSSVRERANKILSIFTEVDGGQDQSMESTPVLQDSNQSTSTTTDLLLDIDTPTPVQSTPVVSLDDLQDPVVDSGVDMFSGLNLSETNEKQVDSNDHLAALLAPSPPSDPFPEALAPLQTETQLPAAAPPIQQNLAPTFPAPNMAQQPMMGYGMTYPGQMMMNPNLNTNLTPNPYFMQQMPHPGMLQSSGPPGVDNRGEVPLSAFVGPAHTERRNSAGKNNPAFGFIGDHMTQLRGKK
eukprot:g5972.t1